MRTRRHVTSRLLILAGGDFRLRACISPESPKLDSTRSLVEGQIFFRFCKPKISRLFFNSLCLTLAKFIRSFFFWHAIFFAPTVDYQNHVSLAVLTSQMGNVFVTTLVQVARIVDGNNEKIFDTFYSQGRPGGVVVYQYTRKKVLKIPENTQS